MAKGSYFQKHREKLEEEGETNLPQRLQRKFIISDSLRESYEAGKIILIDKPLHWTSFDVVRKIRGALRIKKVGHAGTLDPLASGLLILCTGKFTKKINEFMAQEKEYTGTITLGSVTPTYDLESDRTDFKPTESITIDLVNEAVCQLSGSIMQKPPIYAAIKKQGTALYDLARRGESVDPEARPVTVYSFEINPEEFPVLSFKVRCSTGTYIRSLANDLGVLLGCGAHLSALRRTMIGDFHVNQAMDVEKFLNNLTEDEPVEKLD